ncbi:MAG: hypothetical protein JWM54_949 [Acidobacteriaceae bacterium]|nr:hypothetical protein [Acidobacteriaceae bacterium]
MSAARSYRKPRRSHLLLAILNLALVGCRLPHQPGTPSLEITQVPAADPGGPGRLDFIEGRTRGAASGQQVVLYVHSGSWWVQPFANQPFTKIQSDATWKNSTHLGTEYAALLVQPDYHPAPKLAALPREGDGVLAVVVAKGKAGKPIIDKVIRFSGFDWHVRAAGSDRGGETNPYDPDNAWTDNNGYLHLRIRASEGEWSCAEVSLARSLGYGSYRFVVQDISHMEPAAVLGMFTWDEAKLEDTRKELDIEISQWGKPGNKNAQYVVQPFYVPGNLARFSAPPGELTHLLRWQLGSASFNTVRGNGKSTGSKLVSEHLFTSGVPVAAGENVHIDLYAYHHTKDPLQHEAEVVIESFDYLP